MKKLKILDCSLRDGGYYNDWNYDPQLVDRYLSAMSASGVDIVEIGLRSTDFQNNLGPFAYSTDEYLKTLRIDPSFTLGVMINAKEYLTPDKQLKTNLLKLSFNEKSDSPVGLVRIVATIDELPFLEELISNLHALGYELGLNIMQIGSVSEEKILENAKKVNFFDKIKVLYFADSFGNLDPSRISGIISTFQKFWVGDIGIHTHDNMGLAHINAITAYNSGVSWIDATVLGMGRGAGNSRTENILIDFHSRGFEKYDPEAIFEIVTQDFSDLQKVFGWGSNLYYHLSALYNIHPTFIQEMLNLDGITGTQIINAINYLKGIETSSSFKSGVMNAALSFSSISSKGSFNPSEVFEGRSVLILAKGEDAYLHKAEIERFIKRRNPLVISLNIETAVNVDLVNIVAACNPARLVSDMKNYSCAKKALMVPIGALKDSKSIRDSNEIHDYGIEIKNDEFTATSNGCVLPYPLAFGYVAAACIAGNAKNIYLAGFNGYPAGDKRNNEMSHLISLIMRKYKNIKFVSLTKSIYDFEKQSLYDPNLL